MFAIDLDFQATASNNSVPQVLDNNPVLGLESEQALVSEFSRLNTDRYFVWAKTNDTPRLQALFLKLLQQNRWIYFIHDQVRIKSAPQPILQVKLKQHHSQFECLQKIIEAGHCSALVLEKLDMNAAEFMQLNQICAEAKVLIILLDNSHYSTRVH